MKKILILVLVLVVIGAIVVIAGIGGNDKYVNDDLASYFQDKMVGRAIERMGAMPIEGFDADLLLGAYSGLRKEDFVGVEAFEGVYTLEEDELVFTRTVPQPISSAESTISDVGYMTLLSNVSERFDLEIETEEDIDGLIDLLDSSSVITLGVGEKGSGGGVEIEVVNVSEDSRCPSDVECIQAGTIRVETLLISGLGTANQVFEPGIPITTEAEEVRLVSVTPYPVSTQEIAEGDYEFVFVVKPRENIE